MHKSQPQSQKFTLPSGAELAVSVANFGASSALLKAILKAVKDGSKDIDFKTEVAAAIKEGPAAMGGFFDRLINVAISDEVEACVFTCGEWATYKVQGQPEEKFNRGLFDHPDFGDQAREDFYMASFRIMEVNVKPFFKAAFSAFLKRQPAAPSSVPATR